MSSLFIPEEVQTEYLLDIFGNRSNKGLIDSDSASDFDARLMSLRSSWDEREVKHCRKETPQFYSYFLANIIFYGHERKNAAPSEEIGWP